MTQIYVSDLDGTLLRNDATLSPFSRSHLVQLLNDGLAFTVASARSVVSMQAILGDLPVRLPVVAANGAFLSDLSTGRHEIVNAVDPEIVSDLFEVLSESAGPPILCTFDGREERVYYSSVQNEGMAWYINDRKSARDPRLRLAPDPTEHLREQVVYVGVVDRQEALAAAAAAVVERFSDAVAVNLFENRYSPGWFWLAVQDRKAIKAQALRGLLSLAGFEADDLVAFGDDLNDREMLGLAGKAVAVENAIDEVKLLADVVIGPNQDDSVVRYILSARGREAATA